MGGRTSRRLKGGKEGKGKGGKKGKGKGKGKGYSQNFYGGKGKGMSSLDGWGWDQGGEYQTEPQPPPPPWMQQPPGISSMGHSMGHWGNMGQWGGQQPQASAAWGMQNQSSSIPRQMSSFSIAKKISRQEAVDNFVKNPPIAKSIVPVVVTNRYSSLTSATKDPSYPTSRNTVF